MNAAAKYVVIAQNVIASIEKGHLQANSKLPSLRHFCKLHDISMTTALTCYRYLEQRGYVVAEYKKGYFVLPLKTEQGIKHFPIFQSTVTKNLIKLELQTDLISKPSLATAQLDAELIDDTLIKRSFRSITKQTELSLQYDEIQGNKALRWQLSNYFKKQGFMCHHDDLVVTHGCLDAVLIALECVSKPGDVIAVTSPCYSGLLNVLGVLDRAILEIPSTNEGIELGQLEQAMKRKEITACLLTANHQNPTGHSLSNQQKQLLIKLANQYSIPLIEDDVFRELSHQQTIPLPLKYFDQQGWVIWCSSVSKTLAPGLRLGWCLPGRFKNEFIQQRMIRSLGHNQPIQLALADYIANGYYETHVKRVNRAISAQCSDYVKFLKNNLPEQAEIFVPSGGLVLWVKIPNVNTQQLAVKLAKQGVYIKPGNLFSTTKLYQDCVRLNIGLIPSKAIYSQLELLCQLVHIEKNVL
ncbi:PLP-dependent aminotransferase family protein [Rheinheimera maricola]|uniref:PLP-dependent aminotransferase family protein n=1 Tax=Rheinheimera maricola TaxID=2793282 RepID=A0ABS7X6A7_9GAMM|nr:PLP-dependent aminotransferase family protein [Rheinheimera maricola]MBZ9611081.1 PLP-dependent aminotransferase family protein [Rheinheimera maricola]